MRIILAFDSFKGSLTAREAVEAVAQGVLAALPHAEIVEVPLADGGEGTARMLTDALGGRLRSSSVHGPLMEPVDAEWGWIAGSRTAVIEMAAAAGLGLVPTGRRNPLTTTTYGVGDLIEKALDAGAQRILVGVGGSATVDGGTGMAEALGIRFEGCRSPMSGERLSDVRAVDLSGIDRRISGTTIQAVLDVSNPLLGPSGAAVVFGPQKGATPRQVRKLESGLRHLATFFPNASPDTPGAGAAGGLGWGLKAFLDAKLMSGIDLCLDATKFDEVLRHADLVLTGEGSFDRQSLEGKVPSGVAGRARRAGVPTVVLAGDASVAEADCRRLGVAACHSIITDLGVSYEKALRNASTLLRQLAERILPDVIDRHVR